MRIIAVHQPQYIPWLGYFDKLDQSDIFCLLDTVQYKKNEYQNRNRIKTDKGWQWLTIPVMHRFSQSICEVKIDTKVPWKRKHLEALRTHYRKALFYDLCIESFEKLYEKEYHFLVDINFASIRLILNLLGLQRELVLSSQLPIGSDHPTERLVEICRCLGADTYLSGRDGAKYMDIELFERHGIQVHFQNFRHPVYPQLYDAFELNMSTVDLLFNCGVDSLAILREARQEGMR